MIKERVDYMAMINSLDGRFAKQKPYVPYFMDLGSQAIDRYENGDLVFAVTEEDVDMWPVLRGREEVRLREIDEKVVEVK